MALVVLAIMGGLITLAGIVRKKRPLFAAILGFTTFLILPVYTTGDAPLHPRALIEWMRVGWFGVAAFFTLAALVYGGIGFLVNAYVGISIDTRRVRIGFSMLLGGIISTMAYVLVIWITVTNAPVNPRWLAGAFGVGALTALVAAFAATHERPRGCSFFQSRDGGTVLAALIGAVACTGGLNILMQRVPGPLGVQGVVVNLLAGGSLGAALTIPLRAIESNRLARSLLGAVIGVIVMTAAFRGPTASSSLAGLGVGAAVGALLTDGPPDAADEADPEE